MERADARNAAQSLVKRDANAAAALPMNHTQLSLVGQQRVVDQAIHSRQRLFDGESMEIHFVPYPGPVEHQHFAAPMDKAESTRVGLSMGAGNLTVKGGAGDLVAADFTYNVPEWKPSTVQSASGTQSEVQISQGSSTHSGGNTENQW